MKARPSFCGWCIDGQCCGGRTFITFTCIHTWRCEPMLSPAERRARDEHIKAKALGRAARMREENKEDQMFMMEAIHAGWEQLDREVAAILSLSERLKLDTTGQGLGDREQASYDLGQMKARSRGKAELLALFMPHPLNTADAISAEALERWKAHQNGEVRQTLTMHAKPQGEG
jgi:hypothetical protein